MSGTVTAEEKFGRLGWLDELRGLAAIMVIIGHYGALFAGASATATTFIDILPRGVQLFYILSGYVLFRLYAERIASWQDYKSFLIKRFFRIAPLFYVVTVLCALVFAVPDLWRNLALHFMILPFGFSPQYLDSMIGIEWSVFVECWFYVLFPVLVFCFRRRPLALLCLCLAVSLGQTVAIYLSGMAVDARTFWYKMPQTQMIFFATGFWIAMRHLRSNPRKKILDTGLFYAGLLGMMILPFAVKAFTIQLYAAWILLSFIIYAYPFIKKTVWLSAALDWAGKRSYSIYLIHMPLLKLLENNHVVPVNFLSGLGCMAVTLLLSAITWHFVEQPGIRLGQWIITQRVFAAGKAGLGKSPGLK